MKRFLAWGSGALLLLSAGCNATMLGDATDNSIKKIYNITATTEVSESVVGSEEWSNYLNALYQEQNTEEE